MNEREAMEHAFHWRCMVLAEVFIALFLVPVAVSQLLRRTGHNPAWSPLILIPGMNLLGTWFFAFKSWPIQRKGSTQS